MLESWFSTLFLIVESGNVIGLRLMKLSGGGEDAGADGSGKGRRCHRSAIDTVGGGNSHLGHRTIPGACCSERQATCCLVLSRKSTERPFQRWTCIGSSMAAMRTGGGRKCSNSTNRR